MDGADARRLVSVQATWICSSPCKDRGEQARDPKQARDLDALNVARAWGDLLGAEVHVRPMWNEQMRIEVEFDFASEGLALAERLTSVVAGGSTRR